MERRGEWSEGMRTRKRDGNGKRSEGGARRRVEVKRGEKRKGMAERRCERGKVGQERGGK